MTIVRSALVGLTLVATLASAAGVIGLTWQTVQQTTETQRLDAIQRTNAAVNGLAASYTQQINRQTLALDQTLDAMTREWEADPSRFDLEGSRRRATSLTGIASDMFLTDENGVIRQASVPDFIGQGAGDLDVFRDAVEHGNDKPSLYLGSAAVNPLMRQWHLDAARTLHHKDGSFAGIIDTDYRVSAITGVFAASPPAGDGFAAVISLTDGKLRATFGAAGGTPDANIADTKMFSIVDAAESGLWVGPSATDAVTRVHAFRRLPGRDLVVVAALNQQEAMQPVAIWQRQTTIFASVISGLTGIVCLLIFAALYRGWRRANQSADVRTRLAAANALAEVSRAHAGAIERRLHATFAAVADGVAIFDPHLNLVEWSALFPERSGVNSSFVRTGMPMEDVLRTQAKAGYFGEVADVEAEVDRRAALLRAGNFGASLSFQTASQFIELRCLPLPEGGFVALYTDVTDARRARRALRQAREALHREQASRMGYLEVIAHELSTRVAALTRWIARPDANLAPVRRIAGSLAGLASDIVEVPLMAQGVLASRPALVGVPSLLRDIVDTIQPAAQDRGITMYHVVNATTPPELIADPGRIRQIVTTLVDEALRFAAPDTVWLLADGGESEPGDQVALRVTVRAFGTPLPEETRARVFPGLDAMAVPLHGSSCDPSGNQSLPGNQSLGTGFGPAIALHLTTLMGGQLRCEGWSTIDGRTGNDFILTLPPDLLPGQRGRAPGHAPAEGRPLPRTRILLAGDLTGPRLAAATMLRRDGHLVDAVATADETTRNLRNALYDIAFIDAVLPDMTVEATIMKIRDLTGPARTAPLIVLAHSPDEVMERALRDAGADAILPANPTLEDMTSAIGDKVWPGRSFGSAPGSMRGPEGETEDGIPILSAARIVELRANIPRDELLEMVEECLSDLFHRLPALRRSLAAGSLGAVAAQAHAMVGMAGGYGMAVLEARLRAILNAVRARRLDTIEGAATVIETDLARGAAALRRAMKMPEPARSGART